MVNFNGLDYYQAQIVSYEPYFNPSCGGVTGNIVSYIREDLGEKKVYRYDPFTEEEYLLYDFSLGVNDFIPLQGFSFFYCFGVYSDAIYISEITTEQSFNGVPIKTYHLAWDYNGEQQMIQDLKIYEGMGSNSGLDYVSIHYEFYTQLQSVSLLNSENLTVNVGKINVYPNPFTDSFTIETLENIEQYTLFDTTGKRIGQSESKYAIEQMGKNLKQGMYFLLIQPKNASPLVRYLLKN